ncbi:20499_t:CDS:2 [Entrophospora sp. SA101]|nr:20499_t:CDS:2 [Entrophospora sp. SA101]
MDPDVLLGNCHADIQAMLDAWCMITGEAKSEQDPVPVDILAAVESTTKAVQSIRNYTMVKDDITDESLAKIRSSALEVLEMISDLEKTHRDDDTDDSGSEDGHLYKSSNYTSLDKQRATLQKYIQIVEEFLLFDDKEIYPPNTSYLRTNSDDEKKDSHLLSQLTPPLSPGHPNLDWSNPDHFGSDKLARYHAFLEAHRPSKSKRLPDYTPLPDPKSDKAGFFASLAERGEHRTSGDSGISSVSVIHSPLPDERGILSGPVMPPFGDPPWDDLLKMISKDICNRRLTKFITTPKLGIEILNFDETRLRKKYKVGVLYCAPNQTTEEEWFSNTTTSKYFDDFLSILGAKVRLLGFEGFGGGLDTRTDGTGEYSLYDNGTWKDFEIMYHVSTMLPYDKVDRHQIVRKRHIGNDISCIIFQDTFRPFSPASIRSKFLHVFVIVSPVQLENGKVGHRVEIVSKDSVPYFGPPLPDPPIFDDTLRLKKFLIAAVINGQNAAWKTAQLAEPFLRARRGIIENITNRLVPNPKNRIDNNESKTSAENVHKKPTQEELDHTLRRLFVEQLKSGGPPPDIVQVQTLLKQGANPNIKIPQPKSSKPKPKPSNQLDSSNYQCDGKLQI